MDNYYTEAECTDAIVRATHTINELTKQCDQYTRGTNDCAAFLMEYDKALRGSAAQSRLDFQWSNPREFLVKLGRQGFTVASYLEHCGYEIVKNNRPATGDVAFCGGAMIASPSGWLSTSEDNTGVSVAQQLMYLELKINIIARPLRS